MTYSFDGYAIGVLKGSSLLTREIRRPRGIDRNDWYDHAAQVCKLLNAIRRDGQSRWEMTNDMERFK